MDKLLAFGLGAAAVALFGPARRRVVPVVKAAGRAGVGIASAAANGATGIARALVRGDVKAVEQEEQPVAAG